MSVRMANTYSALHYHIVFSTKNRQRWFKPGTETRLWEILGGIVREHRIRPIQIGGFEEHIHALMSLPPALAPSKAVQYLKGLSSKWFQEQSPRFKAFAWQDGFAAFTVSKSHVGHVIEYIRDQHIHHARLSFDDELRALLRKHEVEFDERYVLG
jgi:putative transposase